MRHKFVAPPWSGLGVVWPIRGLLATTLPTPVFAHQAGGTLGEIRDAGTIALGYRADAMPFSFVDRNGRPATRSASATVSPRRSGRR